MSDASDIGNKRAPLYTALRPPNQHRIWAHRGYNAAPIEVAGDKFPVAGKFLGAPTDHQSRVAPDSAP